ncbi:murein DD-endopeptidase MepM [Buchnera aphidicola]|uniref:murein DD-endopeptidase MepM n=1 Tax=Buchnera aphidicola TaxID=9 RepID=UPI00164CA0D4|nr:murein DD-endopeptidase MepM [Buchnera aphidicola]
MQQIYKTIFVFFNQKIFSKIIKILINIIFIIILILLSNCNFLTNTEESFLNQKNLQQKKEFKKFKKIKEYLKTYENIVTYGDKISVLLKKSGVKINDILQLIKSDKNLNNLKIGQKIYWKRDKLGNLITLKWYISKFQKKIYKRYKNEFKYNKSDFVLEKKSIYIKKNSNFFKSANQAGLNQSEINTIIEAIEWQINFHKLNIGSKFHLIFLNKKTNNKKTSKTLLGIKLDNLDKEYFSIKAQNGRFYDANGFNKSEEPINFSFLKKYRISSPFNLHRLNPVTHRISRHLGIDLAMPQGTPVIATSNGKIIKAQFNKIAGFYISLKNNNYYTTRYMHLKKILVKVGQKVKKGQIIAFSGNTGRTTGPHLHYEIWINHHAIDPIKAKCIFLQQLTKKERIRYLQESKKILSKLK